MLHFLYVTPRVIDIYEDTRYTAATVNQFRRVQVRPAAALNPVLYTMSDTLNAAARAAFEI